MKEMAQMQRGNQTHRLVVIDDEYIVITGISAIIERENLGCTIIGTAEDGIHALEVIRETKPDVVITDIRIPGMDGLSLIEECREFLPDTAYIVISGYTEFEYARRALSLGVKEYIDKPVTIEKLTAAIRKLDRDAADGADNASGQINAQMKIVVRAIMDEDPSGYTRAMKELFGILEDFSASPEIFRGEIFKNLAAVMEIFSEQNKASGKSFKISYSDMEQYASFEDIRKYAEKAAELPASYMQGEKTGSRHRIVREMLQYIDDNYSRDFGLNELADVTHMNPAYLSILFKEEAGQSFVKYLTSFRMKKAKELLDEGYKVVEVSDMVGYNNYRYFCDIFKRLENMTPNEYKGCTRKKEQTVQI